MTHVAEDAGQLPKQIADLMNKASEHENHGEHHRQSGNAKLFKAHKAVSDSFRNLIQTHYDHVNSEKAAKKKVNEDFRSIVETFSK